VGLGDFPSLSRLSRRAFAALRQTSAIPAVAALLGTHASYIRDLIHSNRAREIDNDLPKVAVVPVMKRKSFKQLGTPTVQAGELAHSIKELSDEELLELAEEERERQEEAGELDAVGDVQPEKPPAINDSIVGTELEICWRCASSLACALCIACAHALRVY
jgi:hypothetical protein